VRLRLTRFGSSGGVEGTTVPCAWFAFAVGVLPGCNAAPLSLGGGGDSGCVPGTYAGSYDCHASADSAFQATGSGPISFELEGDRGGEALHIAPGTKITAAQAGGVTSADLSGTLDCTTYRLTGSVSNANFSSTTLTIATRAAGDFSAGYDAGASPPELVNGVLNVPVPQEVLGTISETCQWTATLQP
jgi:hypothetical protein